MTSDPDDAGLSILGDPRPDPNVWRIAWLLRLHDVPPAEQGVLLDWLTLHDVAAHTIRANPGSLEVYVNRYTAGLYVLCDGDDRPLWRALVMAPPQLSCSRAVRRIPRGTISEFRR